MCFHFSFRLIEKRKSEEGSGHKHDKRRKERRYRERAEQAEDPLEGLL